VTDNHIVFNALSGTETTSSRNTRFAFSGNFLVIDDATEALVSDNVFEIVEVNDSREFTGIHLRFDENAESVKVQNNTLLVKDSKVGNIVGVSVTDEIGVGDEQLRLINNKVILDNSEVGNVSSIKYTDMARSQREPNGSLIFRGHNVVTGGVDGFDTFQFDLATATDNPMLTIDSLDLSDRTLIVNSAGLTSPSNALQLVAGDVTMNNVTVQTAGTFATKSMVIESNATQNLMLGDFYGELMAQESVLSDSTLTLSDSQLATVALTRLTSEEALNLLQSTENLSSDAPLKGFATLSGSSNFYELGTGFDLNGTSLTVGGALRINDKWSGVGFANFSDANADSTVSGFRGDSDMKTYSAGVALRYQTEMPFYTEGALVVGQADTDFVGYYTNDTARYDSKRFYTTAQLGVGTNFALSDNVNLNVYGRYSFTYLDGDKVSLNNTYNDTFDVDDTMVHAMRVGARVKGSVAPNVQWFAGAAFERVLDGDVEAMVKDAKLKTETLKGNVGIFEVGATLAPNGLGPWTMDVKAGAYAGDRRGVSGSVSVNYVF